MQIHIKDLVIETTIGVYDWEREQPRKIILNLKVEIDASNAVASDDVEDTVDYDALCEAVNQVVNERYYKLIETLAAKIVDKVSTMPKVQTVDLEIDKPGAVKGARSVSVRHCFGG